MTRAHAFWQIAMPAAVAGDQPEAHMVPNDPSPLRDIRASTTNLEALHRLLMKFVFKPGVDSLQCGQSPISQDWIIGPRHQRILEAGKMLPQ